jgi:hypothetical protein
MGARETGVPPGDTDGSGGHTELVTAGNAGRGSGDRPGEGTGLRSGAVAGVALHAEPGLLRRPGIIQAVEETWLLISGKSSARRDRTPEGLSQVVLKQR